MLTALSRGDRIEPESPDAAAAYWITQLGGDPRALLQVLDSLVATPDEALRRVEIPTLVVVGDEDHDHASAERARRAPAPGPVHPGAGQPLDRPHRTGARGRYHRVPGRPREPKP